MARMSLEDRRRQLVTAAITVMTRDGVRAATTRAVVAEADTSLSVFHYCFDSKHQLLMAVVTELALRNTRSDDDLPAPLTPTEARAAIRLGIETYWADVLAHPDVHQLTYEVTQFCLRDPALEGIAVQQYELYAQAVLTQFERAGLRTRLPLATLARHLAVVVDGATLDWLVRRNDEESRAVLEAEITFLESMVVDDSE